MFLKILYSEPEGLFEEIEFKDGFNIIVAHRPEGVTGGSLNGVGKSTALDLIDFCLLGSYKKNSGNRLVAAQKLIEDYQIVLEFEVDGLGYVIKRSAAAPNTVLFGKSTDKDIEEMSVSSLTPILCDLIFLPRNYRGKYSNKWYRTLINFFIKVHKNKGSIFVDPIQYMPSEQFKLRDAVYYHLFLLGINNELFYKNSTIVGDYKKADDAKRKIEEIAQETYDGNIADKKGDLQQVKRDLKKLEKNISSFQLAENYQDAENSANLLTKELKDLWLDNVADRKRIGELERSISEIEGFSPTDARRISAIYKELSEDLGVAIKSTLSQAVEYRKKLSESRYNFMVTQTQTLKSNISSREIRIKELEKKRAEVLSFLSAKQAINDLSEAYMALSRKREDLSELESMIGTNDRIERELLEIKNYASKTNIEIKDFIDSIQDTDVQGITNTFLDVYGAIYKDEPQPTFSITENMDWDSKVDIKVKVPAGLSKARNQGRILVYDLTVLLTMIKNQQRGPRFLIHDGVFDGMDPAHFANLYRFIEEESKKDRFQYIATINEGEGRGALESELKTDEVSMSSLIEDAILVLTPDHKFFGENFDE